MFENQNKVEINASAKKVWEILIDLECYSEWNPLLYQGFGKVELGNIVEVFARTATKDMKFICKVNRFEPFKEFSWTFHVIHPILFWGEHIFRIEPISNKKVLFIDCERFKGLLSPLQAKDLKTNGLDAMIGMGKALKNKAERS